MKPRPYRQLNVQQQNALEEQQLRSTAMYWRENGIPEALRKCGQERGVNWNRSVIVDLETEFPGIPSLFGVVLTQDKRFIRFEVETNGAEEVQEWSDITSKQNLNEHNRGTGVGNGALALKILREFQT
jgi:hypothetical protein